MQHFISIVLNGLLIGGVYGLVSSAWSFQVGQLRFANFAYGASLMLAMYLTYYSLSEWNLPIPVMILLVLAACVLLGWVLRKTILRISDRYAQILCTMALNLILINAVNFVCTSYPRDLGILEHRIPIAGTISIGVIQLACFVMSGVILLSFDLFLKKTWTGRSIRAVVQNSEVATLMGIKSERMLDLAFSLSYILIGIAGIMLMTMFQVEPTYGDSVSTIAFLVCVLGSLGNMKGAFISGLIIGVVSSLITGFAGASLHDPLLYSGFIVILLFRPYGLFKKRSEVARDI